MKTIDKKKFVAAIAAVTAYIKTQEEASYIPDGQGHVEDSMAVMQQNNNIWGISGRQTQMQANTMMQLRIFK